MGLKLTSYIRPIILCLVLLIDSLRCNSYNNNGTTNQLILKKFFSKDIDYILQEFLFPESNFSCGKVVNITRKYGFIKSPSYPHSSYEVPIICQWNINGTLPNEIIIISFEELDIEIPRESHKGYCDQNYLKISSNGKEQLFCGTDNNPKVFISTSNQVSVIFNATVNRKTTRGFYFSYYITPKYNDDCLSNEFRCGNGRCILKKWLCNGRQECGDGTDEDNCPISRNNLLKCGDDITEFYSPSERCDSKFDCKNKADEKDCSTCEDGKFLCPTTRNCIDSNLICNGFPDCEDFADELNCDFCPAKSVRCGSMNFCYDIIHRCNKVLDCPNGADEVNCVDACRGRISCASGNGCYEVDERCNGIVQCADYSDEKNCTLDLCRPDKGSFLCSNGRCIPSVWTCDRSADCYDGSDEMRCLKNSVITAAIIGSLICGLLIVIAISCACKLAALRHMERYRSSGSNSYSPRGFPNREFPFPTTSGELDASLFRLDHTVFLREPPPSYASAMGGYQDVNAANSSYMEQYRRYRRQRRCRRMMRRQHRNNGQIVNNGNGSINLVINETPSDQVSVPVNDTSATNQSPINSNLTFTEANDPSSPTSKNILNKSCSPKNETATESSSMPVNTGPSSSGSNHSSSHSSLTDNLNIELEPIPPLTNFDCDSQPLIR